jgi:hypothetical protein
LLRWTRKGCSATLDADWAGASDLGWKMAFRNARTLRDQRLHLVGAIFAVSVRCLAAFGVSLGWCAALAADVRLTEGTVVRFADVRSGVEALTRRDDYIGEMSPFDRQVRPKSDRPVSEAEMLAFFAQHVQPWSAEEIGKLTPLIAALGKKADPWKLKLPPVILLVKTTGREEGGAAYCRGAAIVLPQNMISGSAKALEQVLPHELFHVLSSHNPDLREALYQTIGFQSCNEVQLPESLRARKITNPDAPVNNHFITVTQDGRALELMPVLFSKTERYDPARGGSLFAYMQFKLMALENDNGTRRPALVDGQGVLLEPRGVPGYHEQVGRNTTYIIHPEEILADNFVFLLDGRINLPTPRVVQEMGKVLQAANTN